MLDPERPPVVPDVEAVPEPGSASTPGAAGAGLWRRLVVIAICGAVALGTVVAVEVSGGSSSPGSATLSLAPSAAAAPGLTSESRVPRLVESKSLDRSGNSVGGTLPGDQIPADPAAALDGLLSVRALALKAGDREAWLAGVAPPSDVRRARFRATQGQVYDRVRALRPADWSYQVAGGYPVSIARRSALGGRAWLADVQLVYRLRAGGSTVRRQQFLTMVPGIGGGWLIADDTDGSTGRDLWDQGPIAQAASGRCLVIGARTRRIQVRQLAAECGRSAATVDQAWGRSWPRRTVLTVPDNIEQLATLLGRTETAGLAQTAAVTIGPSSGPADAVLINGPAFDQLSAVGRRVVLTHEFVHVATRATGDGSAPTWLAEGYADAVAYAGSGLSARTVAGAALGPVEVGRLPVALPAADDFAAAGDQAASAYGLSWVAVRLIADRAGDPRRMRTFYRQAARPAADGEPDPVALEAALVEVGLGDTAAFVKVWQSRLRQLAD